MTYSFDNIGSARDVLIELFRICDDYNPVNYGGADEAADEVIETLKYHGFLIVSNTPNQTPTQSEGAEG